MRKIVGLLLLAAIPLVGCATPKGSNAAEKRAYIDGVEKDVLAMACEKRPALEAEINKAAGYGVFANVNIMLLFVGGGGGYGVVIDNATHQRTYMKMGEGELGIGLGAKDFRAVFVFSDTDTMKKFVYSGWHFGAEADAALKADDQGGAATAAGDVHSGIRVYQFTQSGAIASANIQGTKYWRDSKLNE